MSNSTAQYVMLSWTKENETKNITRRKDGLQFSTYLANRTFFSVVIRFSSTHLFLFLDFLFHARKEFFQQF